MKMPKRPVRWWVVGCSRHTAGYKTLGRFRYHWRARLCAWFYENRELGTYANIHDLSDPYWSWTLRRKREVAEPTAILECSCEYSCISCVFDGHDCTCGPSICDICQGLRNADGINSAVEAPWS